MKYCEMTPVIAQQTASSIWREYSVSERIARGLPAGASLDLCAGERVEPPITVRYCEPIVSDDGTIAALPVDSYVETLNGIGGIDVSTARAAPELSTKLRNKVP